MGAEREDTDPHPSKGGTEPGLGNPSAGSSRAAAASGGGEGGPAAVDFDALHAALGDPIDFDDLPAEAIEQLAESSGRSSATYSSSRPHTIPPSYSPVEDMNAPPVIVASDDTIPSAPPQMTVPVGPSGSPLGRSGPAAAGRAPSTPHHLGAPSSGPHPSAPPARSYPPEAHAFKPARGPAQMTMRMPERPMNPRRARTPTLIVRSRGPSAKQRLVAFMAMLLLVTACGIAVIIWRKPRWLGLDPNVPLTAATTAPVVSLPPPDPSAASAALPVAPGHVAASAVPAMSASASATPSATPSIRILRPRAPPPLAAPALPAPHPSANR